MTKAVEDDDQVENTTSSWYKVQLREEVGSFSSLFKQAKPDEDEIKDFFFSQTASAKRANGKIRVGRLSGRATECEWAKLSNWAGFGDDGEKYTWEKGATEQTTRRWRVPLLG